MMNLVELSDLFNIEKPSTLTLSSQHEDKGGIPFVSSTGSNNGVSALIEKNATHRIYIAGTITVPLKGTVLFACLQLNDFYCAHQIAVLTPKIKMTDNEKLFYCQCIRKNKYKFNYGRQADRTLEKLKIPAIIPSWVYDHNIPDYSAVKEMVSTTTPNIPVVYGVFKYTDLFKIEKGRGPQLKKARNNPGVIPLITATAKNNGVSCSTSVSFEHRGNKITVAANGSVGEAFFQPNDFVSTGDINVLTPLFNSSKEILLYIVTLIRKEKPKFNYGRKWSLKKMKKSTIRLPVDTNGDPDWQYMEDYIKSLPWSAGI